MSSKTKRKTSAAKPASESRAGITIVPRNLKQREYIRTINECDFTFGIGPAGVGKSWCPTLLAMDGLERGKYERIVVCRPAITAGNERIGFLPGNIDEKLDPFLRPIFDTFSEFWSPRTIQLYRQEKRIDVIPFGYLRGMTMKNSFIIADEVQNTTMDQMYMLLTRLGEGSKMCLTGDPSQCDLSSDTIVETKKRLSNIEKIGWIEFDDTDVIRHPTVADIIRAWNWEKTHK